MSEVDFWITAAWPEADDRNRPVLLKYVLEDKDGKVGEFTTPITSKLAIALRPDLIRDRGENGDP